MKTTSIELTNNEIVAAFQALNSIDSREIGTDTAFRLALNLKTLRSAVESYQEFRESIHRSHCEVDDRNRLVVDEERQQYVFKSAEDEIAGTEKVKTLNRTAVALSVYVFPLALFGKANIAHVLLEPLAWMFVQPQEEEPAPAQSKRKAKA
jgi:hypothetical protein